MAQVSPKKAASATRKGRRSKRFQLFLIWVILILTDHLPPSSAAHHHHHHRSSASSSRKAMLFRTATPPQLHAAVSVSALNQPTVGEEGNVYDEDKRIIHTELMVAKLLAFSAWAFTV